MLMFAGPYLKTLHVLLLQIKNFKNFLNSLFSVKKTSLSNIFSNISLTIFNHKISFKNYNYYLKVI